jgi:hypothetical protein
VGAECVTSRVVIIICPRAGHDHAVGNGVFEIDVNQTIAEEVAVKDADPCLRLGDTLAAYSKHDFAREEPTSIYVEDARLHFR